QANQDRRRCGGTRRKARSDRARALTRARAGRGRTRGMGAHIIDGTAIAAALRAKVAAEVRRLVAEHRLIPGLAVVVVGETPACASPPACRRSFPARRSVASC